MTLFSFRDALVFFFSIYTDHWSCDGVKSGGGSVAGDEPRVRDGKSDLAGVEWKLSVG